MRRSSKTHHLVLAGIIMLISALGSGLCRAASPAEHKSPTSGFEIVPAVNNDKATPATVQSYPTTVENQKRIPASRAYSDSTKRESAIKTWLNDNDKLKLWLTLIDDQTVDIGVFNILGKKVKDLDHSYMTEGDMKELLYSISDIPNGVYIVAAQGSNFRSAIRIVISR